MIVFFIVCIVVTLLYLLIGAIQHKKYNKKEKKTIVEEKGISLLVPCYNEGAILKNTLKSITNLEYSNLQIIFINDGSTDNTHCVLKKILKLKKDNSLKSKLSRKLKYNSIRNIYASNKYENIYLIDKVNGGKADSLNAGIDFSDKDFVVTLDADSILKDDALKYINEDLQNEDVIAVGGNVMVMQGVEKFTKEKISSKTKCKFLEYAQFIEYLSVFFIMRNAFCKMKALSIISGAFGVFERKAMIDLKGFEKTIGEDMDISIKFNQYADKNNKEIFYDDRAICFTEAPNTIKDFFKQRVRWQKGLVDVLKKHKEFLFKNAMKKNIAFVIIFDLVFLGHASVIFILLGVIEVIVAIIFHIQISSMIYTEFYVSLILFIISVFTSITIAKNGNVEFKGANKFKMLGVYFYMLTIYTPVMFVVRVYGSIEYIFKKGGWAKITRSTVKHSILA